MNTTGGKPLVHLIHIRKTGGTAIKDALDGITETEGFRLEAHKHRYRLEKMPKSEKAIFVVRDPLKRYVSGFNSRKRQGMPRRDSPWNEEEAWAFARFETPSQLGEALGSADRKERRDARRAMKGIRHVNSNYRFWFKSVGYYLSRVDDILYIGFLESLGEDFEQIKTLLQLPEAVQLPNDEVSSHRAPKSMDKTLTEEASRHLRRWYADDYRFYELCRETAEQIHRDGQATKLPLLQRLRHFFS